MTPENTRPIVLSISGHDPSGGAGIQADIETLNALGCYPTSVITCLTTQDSSNVHRLTPLPPAGIREQAETILADLPVRAIKIGLIGSAGIAKMLASLLSEHTHIPVILDPVLATGGGTDLASDQLLKSILEQLLPLTAISTPNSEEARRLACMQSLPQCADRLLQQGCESVLITGTHEASDNVTNTLYRRGIPTIDWNWPRLPHSYHGSGCTLASAIAAGLAKGLSIEESAAQAQKYTWNALQQGWRPGKGQHVPDRAPNREPR